MVSVFNSHTPKLVKSNFVEAGPRHSCPVETVQLPVIPIPKLLQPHEKEAPVGQSAPMEGPSIWLMHGLLMAHQPLVK